MKSNTLFKVLGLLSTIAMVFVMTGCPDPSDEERDRQLADRSQSQISDNNQILSDKLCENPNDKTHMYRENHDFAEKWYECSETTGVWPPAAKLKLDCIKETYTGMSDQCLECFGEMTSCTASQCWTSCLSDSKGKKCQDCAVEKCSDQMFLCSGVPANQIPDFNRD